MATRPLRIGPVPAIVDLAAGTRWSVQNVSDDHNAVLRISIQPTSSTPPDRDTYIAVTWYQVMPISRQPTESFWMFAEGGQVAAVYDEVASP